VILPADVFPVLKDIAQSSSLVETNKLLKLCLIAAINSPRGQEYILKLQQLPEATQLVIVHVIQSMQSPPSSPQRYPTAEDSEDNEAGVSREHDLYWEEQLSRQLAELKQIKDERNELHGQVGDLSDRLGRFQDANDDLQDRLTKAEDELEKLRSSESTSGTSVKVLKDQLRQQENLIESQEGKLGVAERTIDDLQKTNATLTLKATKNQQLQYLYDELKIERDQLFKKSNAYEKYKQKLQSFCPFEKENQQLKGEIAELQARVGEHGTGEMKSPELEKAVREYQQILPSLEREVFEAKARRNQLEALHGALKEQHQTVLNQQARDQEELKELRDKVITLSSDTTSSPSTPKAPNHDADFDRMRETSR